MSSLTEAMATAARAIEVSEDVDSTLSSILDSAVISLPGINHAGITIAHRDGRMETRAQTDELVSRLDELQYELGEGPCVYAMENQPMVVVNNLRHEQRWPRFVPRAARLGVRSQIGLQLHLNEHVMGGLNLYSTEVDVVDEEVPGLAELFAAHAALALGYARNASQLNRALETRTQIGQALGVLMERHGLPEDQAFSYLRRVSSHTNVKLRDVAAGVVAQAGRRDSQEAGVARTPRDASG
jgi:transcriptional regulator with GAF, ATPase, and Fis domain